MPARKYRRRRVGVTDKRIKRVAKRTILRTAETKTHAEYDATPIELTSTEMTARDLTDVSQGDGSSQRDGSEILPTSFFFRYNFYAKSTGVGDTLRIMLIRWRGASAPQYSDILQLSASAGAKVISHITNDKGKTPKFTVLYDRIHQVPAYANQYAGQARQMYTVRIPASRLAKIKFDTSATTGYNHIYLLATGVTATGNSATSFNYAQNLKFKDF